MPWIKLTHKTQEWDIHLNTANIDFVGKSPEGGAVVGRFGIEIPVSQNTLEVMNLIHEAESL